MKLIRPLLINYLCTNKLFSVRNFVTKMSAEWNPPAKIEDLYAKAAGNQWSSINSPVAGARVEQALPEGPAPLQFYSLFTPNGKLITSN